MDSWICSICGERHEGVPGFSFEAPWTYYTVPREERAARAYLDEDYCVIDDDSFFVRGTLDIPIIGHATPFRWGVWASLSLANFKRERSLADDPNRVKEPPYFGWFMSRIQVYPDTVAMKATVRTQAVGLRPRIELQPDNHPLYEDQQRGITLARATELAEQMRHGWQHPEWATKDY